MWRIRRQAQGIAALAAAAISCALGFGALWHPDRAKPREPAWAAAVAPLARAPIPGGATVGLAVPPGTPPDEAQRLLSETVWRRPDLRWALVGALGGTTRPGTIVSLGDAQVAPSWREVWRSGGLAVWEPAGP